MPRDLFSDVQSMKHGVFAEPDEDDDTDVDESRAAERIDAERALKERVPPEETYIVERVLLARRSARRK